MMKRLISLALVLLLMIPSLTAFAASDEEAFNSLFNTGYLSGELDYEVSIKPNAPLPVFLDPDGSFAEMLSAAKFTYHFKYNTSEDNKKMQSEMNMVISVPDIDSITADFWIDMDLSDLENPVYKVIIKTSDNDKYTYTDYANNPYIPMIPVMDRYIDSASAINNGLMKSIDKSKFKPECKDGKYLIVLDENTVKDLFRSIAVNMSEIFKNYFNALTGTMTSAASVGVIGGADGPTAIYIADETKPEAFDEEINEFFDKLDKVQIFDKDAIVIELELDDRNLIKNQKLSVNIKTNIAELIELFEGEDPFVTKENSNIDVSIIMDLAYSKINEEIDIEFPELTRYNSIDMFEGFPGQPEIDLNKINIIANGQTVYFDVEPVMEGDTVLVPIRAFLNAIGVSDDDIIYRKGNINVTFEDTVVTLTIGSNVALVDGKEVILEEPVLAIEGRALIPSSFIAEAFDCDVDWMPFYAGESEQVPGGIMYITTRMLIPELLSIIIPSNAATEDIEILEEAYQATGIMADIAVVPEENYINKIMVMIAAGEPAVFFSCDNESEWQEKLIEIGAIMPLEELIEEYAPNIQEYLKGNHNFKTSITNKDGHIYFIPFLQAGQNGECGFFLSNTIKNPQNVIMWLDYIYSE